MGAILSVHLLVCPSENKAVYTAAPVAGSWAGAVMIWAGAVMIWVVVPAMNNNFYISREETATKG